MNLRETHILVVDDEPNIRLLVSDELSEYGMVVVTVPDPRSAIEHLETRHFDLVLTDIRMPGMDGLELTEWIGRHHPATDVILMTGYGSVETAAKGLRAGAADYLLKPFGDPELVVASIRRALQKRRLAVEAEQLRDRLARAERLVGVGRLSGAVAHEINNPLGFLMGNLCVLQESVASVRTQLLKLRAFAEGETDPARRLELDDILGAPDVFGELAELDMMAGENLQGVERIANIVRDLRAFSRADSAVPETVSIDDVVRSASNIARCQVRHTAQLELELGGAGLIEGHPGRLAHVVLNLLVGIADLLGGPSAVRHVIKLSTREEPGRIGIRITHRGGPLPPDVRHRLATSFDGSDPPEPNSLPLGWATVRDVIEQHHGAVTSRGEASGAIIIDLTIPVSPGSADEARALPVGGTRAGVAESVEPRRVLLIDDETMLRRTYRAMLGRRFEVATAADGAEALAIIAREAPFDAVVCDLMMPGMDGVTFYAELERVAPELLPRVVLLTGGAVTPRAKTFIATVSSPVVSKPCSTKTLTKAIEDVLG